MNIPKTMDALVMRDFQKYDIEQVPVPAPGHGEVLCAVDSVCICGTDPEILEGSFRGRWPKGFPFIPGHEWSGTVVAVGPNSDGFGFQVGDRVGGTSHCGCGFCRMCTTGRYNLCDNYGKPELGHRQYGHYTNGSYADYMVNSIKSIFKLPDHVSLEEGAMVDGGSIALHSVKRGGVQPGDVVCVVGPGPLGLLAVMCAHAMGAGRVILVGRGERLVKAKGFGAEIVDNSKVDGVQGVRDLTGGRGADLTVDCAARGQTPREAVGMTRKGGRVVLTGVPLEEVALPLQRIVLEEMDVFGVRANRGTCEETIALIAAGKMAVKDLVTHRFPLRDFKKAYEVFTKRIDGALKVLVKPSLK